MEGRRQLPRGTAVYRGNGKDWFQDKQYDLALEMQKKTISPWRRQWKCRKNDGED